MKLEIKQTADANSVLLNGEEMGDNITALVLEMLPPEKPKVRMTIEVYPEEIVLECKKPANPASELQNRLDEISCGNLIASALSGNSDSADALKRLYNQSDMEK